MNRTLHFLFYTLFASNAFTQTQWHNPAIQQQTVINGNSFTPDTTNAFLRIQPSKQTNLREAVWNLSQNTAGLYINFFTNSSNIKIRYQVKGGLSMPHMPATGVSGIDLYMRDCNGKQIWCAGKYAFGDTITYNFPVVEYTNTHNKGNEFTLFLPLYNGVKWMEIGTEKSSEFKFENRSNQLPIVVYGTSIAQGACASRPGMAWSNILQRQLDMPIINLGFSGNAFLEKPVLDIINTIDSRLIILDNLPNLIGKKELSIDSLIENSISSIRQKSSIPILLVDHAGYPDQLYSSSRNKEVENINKQQYTAYLKVKDKYDHIYYLSKQDINMSNDGTVDGVHPTDLGMVEYATAYEKAIRSILNLQKGQCKTTIACRQRREPALYEWNERYENTLSQIKEETPEVIIIGNSILHYWNGIPTAPIVTDTLGWKKAFGNKTVLNMGSGWDKIENALWRVQHGALSGYSAKQVLVKIGTNNLDEDTNEDIVEGIINLAQQIKALQPEAKLTILGLLPRRGIEARIQTINSLLASVCNRLNIPFAEIGSVLLNTKSNTINEALFKDGLHPNEKGYNKLGLQLKKVID